MIRKLNNVQLEVLRWIGNECPDDVMSGTAYKHSAGALRDRHLATVSRRGGWHAELTDLGRYYLEHGDYPPEDKPDRPALKPTRVPRQRVPKSVASPTVIETKPPKPPVEPKPEPAPTRQVRVPEQLRNPHRVVAMLRDSKREIATPDAVRTRALRIVQALADVCDELGWTLQSVEESRTYWGQAWNTLDLFVINTGETSEGVRLVQGQDRTPHVPTAWELSKKGVWSYQPIPEFDYTPNDKLTISLETNWDHRRHTWGDRQRWQLDDKLGELVEEIEHRHERALQRRVERETKEAEQQRQRDIAIREATAKLRESHRAKVLLRQLEDWRTAGELRTYLSEMEARIGDLTGAEATLASEWLTWCRRHAERIDPFTHPIAPPEDPVATSEALRPFLDPWFR